MNEIQKRPLMLAAEEGNEKLIAVCPEFSNSVCISVFFSRYSSREKQRLTPKTSKVTQHFIMPHFMENGRPLR